MVILWNDILLNSRACLPKPLYYATSSICLVLAFLAAKCVITDFYITDKIFSFVAAVSLFYIGLCNVLMILKGGEYVKLIKKENENFLITNLYNEKTNFNVDDVKLVSAERFSLIHFFLVDFSKQRPGLDLTLKSGGQYHITGTMENIDSLKEYLMNERR